LIVAVEGDAAAREMISGELKKRYGEDYEILIFNGSSSALQALGEYQAAGDEVAILLVSYWLDEMNGEEFLQESCQYYPHARRGLLHRWGDHSAAEPVVKALGLGTIDAVGPKPAIPGDEMFHKMVTDFLHEWTAEHRPPFVIMHVLGEQWERRSHQIRDLLERNDIPYAFHDLDSEEGQRLLQQSAAPEGPFPVVLVTTGRTLTNPSNAELAEALNVSSVYEGQSALGDDVVDVVVVGAGPAGLSAAVYGASEGLQTVVLEREALGGQAGMSSRIRNYLGFPRGISGNDLASRAYNQAWLFGANFTFTQEAVGLETRGEERVVRLSDGSEIRTRTVVLAMGARYRQLEIEALDRLVGAGVFYGSAGSEAMALKGQPVYVIGGGNSAGQAAVYLARYARQVTMLVRGESLADSMSEYLISEIENSENVDVRLQTEVVGGGGDYRLEKLVLRDRRTGEEETVEAAALFVLIGATPRTDWLPETVKRDAQGYIMTGGDLLQNGEKPQSWPLQRMPLLLETSVPRVFAAGDVRYRSVKRVASAVGEGSIAIQLIHQVLAG
jgi:thioredoxin reductase (NADPH)